MIGNNWIYVMYEKSSDLKSYVIGINENGFAWEKNVCDNFVRISSFVNAINDNFFYTCNSNRIDDYKIINPLTEEISNFQDTGLVLTYFFNGGSSIRKGAVYNRKMYFFESTSGQLSSLDKDNNFELYPYRTWSLLYQRPMFMKVMGDALYFSGRTFDQENNNIFKLHEVNNFINYNSFNWVPNLQEDIYKETASGGLVLFDEENPLKDSIVYQSSDVFNSDFDVIFEFSLSDFIAHSDYALGISTSNSYTLSNFSGINNFMSNFWINQNPMLNLNLLENNTLQIKRVDETISFFLNNVLIHSINDTRSFYIVARLKGKNLTSARFKE